MVPYAAAAIIIKRDLRLSRLVLAWVERRTGLRWKCNGLRGFYKTNGLRTEKCRSRIVEVAMTALTYRVAPAGERYYVG